MNVSIEHIAATEAHDLRRSVLRDGIDDAQVDWPDDDAPATFHLGALLDRRVIAISTWLATASPHEPDTPAYQLRGMATDPAHAMSGIGSRLLAVGCETARERNAHIVWANARVTALGFYERNGFTPSGPVFTTPATGLPHKFIHRRL